MGKRPGAVAMHEILVDPAFRLLLLPLPAGKPGKRSASSSEGIQESASKKSRKPATQSKAGPRPVPKLPPHTRRCCNLFCIQPGFVQHAELRGLPPPHPCKSSP
eukprot:2152015-Amphidinium_carterae.1